MSPFGSTVFSSVGLGRRFRDGGATDNGTDCIAKKLGYLRLGTVVRSFYPKRQHADPFVPIAAIRVSPRGYKNFQK